MAKRYGRQQKRKHLKMIAEYSNKCESLKGQVRHLKNSNEGVFVVQFISMVKRVLGENSSFLPTHEAKLMDREIGRLEEVIRASKVSIGPIDSRYLGEGIHVANNVFDMLEVPVMRPLVKRLQDCIVIYLTHGYEKHAVALTHEAVRSMSADQIAHIALTALAGDLKRRVTKEMGR